MDDRGENDAWYADCIQHHQVCWWKACIPMWSLTMWPMETQSGSNWTVQLWRLFPTCLFIVFMINPKYPTKHVQIISRFLSAGLVPVQRWRVRGPIFSREH